MTTKSEPQLNNKKRSFIVTNKIIYKNKAIKNIAVLPKKERLKIEAFLDNLLTVTKPKDLPNCKKIIGYNDHYRYRLGHYRILCQITEDNIITILVLNISHRKDVYRGL